jgi:hypothetical protein
MKFFEERFRGAARGKKRKNDGHCRRCKKRKSLTLQQCQVLLQANNIIDKDAQCSSKQKMVLLKSQEN